MEIRLELPEQAELLRLFDYRDGVLYYKTRPSNRVQVGDPVGHLRNGYLVMGLNGSTVNVHRVIFRMHHGYCPVHLDHKDTNKLNNLIDNLRRATHTQNMCNKPWRRAHTMPGVYQYGKRGKWMVRVTYAKKGYNVHSFETKELATEFADLLHDLIKGDFRHVGE